MLQCSADCDQPRAISYTWPPCRLYAPYLLGMLVCCQHAQAELLTACFVGKSAVAVYQAVLTYFTMAVLVYGSARTGAATYSQLVQTTCGHGVMKVLQLSVVAFTSGFSVVYLVSRLPSVLAAYHGSGVMHDALCLGRAPVPHAAAAPQKIWKDHSGMQPPASLINCCYTGLCPQVVIRDILLGSPPTCSGLLCELFGLDPTGPLANPRVVIAAVALLLYAPLLLLRWVTQLIVVVVAQCNTVWGGGRRRHRRGCS